MYKKQIQKSENLIWEESSSTLDLEFTKNIISSLKTPDCEKIY